MPALTGDVTTSAGAVATTIANDAVTYAKMQNVSATSRFLGRITAAAGDPEELTPTQATSLLDAFTSTLKGLAPSSGGGTANFLRADGTWSAPAGAGTVTNTGGNLTANSVVLGAGTTDVKVVGGILTDGISKVTLGVASTSVGSIDLKNATSGTVTIQPATGALGTQTMTVPGGANSVAVVPNTGATNNFLTSLSTGGLLSFAQPSFANLSGLPTPAQGRELFNASEGQTGFAADTYVTGSLITITAGDLIVGARYAFRFTIAKTAAGVAAPVFIVRLGTLGTTGDAAILTFTLVAGTAVVDTAYVDIDFVVRTASATGVIAGRLLLNKNLSTTGFTNTGGQVLVGSQTVSATFNTTTVTKIGVSFNGGTSFAGTASTASADFSQKST